MKIAIVGTGISGLVCAWLLQRDHEIVVFEANDWIGGHTRTVPVEIGGRRFAVDTGFIVFNDRTYPSFNRLLARLDVAWRPADMSFALSCERTGLEYGTPGLDALFAQRRNLLRPSFHRMLRDLLRFHREARALLRLPDEKVTLGEFLEGRGYSEEFVERHIIPFAAAIWSAEPGRIRDFPALTFARFFENHGLLQRRERPAWRTVQGGSWRYVERLVEGFRERVRLSTPVRRIRRASDHVLIESSPTGRERFDQVIVATHSDQALALLADPSEAEQRVLGAIRYQPNDVVLHTDRSLLPRRRRAWCSWNYRIRAGSGRRAAITYHMNRLQGLAAPVELCVTLNAGEAVDPERVIGRFLYHHPIYDTAAVAASRHRAAIDGVRRTHYCGAYWGYGFHEDGVCSALDVTRRFGREL